MSYSCLIKIQDCPVILSCGPTACSVQSKCQCQGIYQRHGAKTLLSLILDSDITHLCRRNRLHKQVSRARSAVFVSSMRVISRCTFVFSSYAFKGRIMQVVSEDISIMYSMEITPQIERVSLCVRFLHC